jgi:hypothetical protein
MHTCLHMCVPVSLYVSYGDVASACGGIISAYIYIYIYTHTHTHTDYRNDVYRLSSAANTWTALLPSGSGPSPRDSMCFAATPDGMLYVFGGYDDSRGNEREWGKPIRYIYMSICYVYIPNEALYNTDVYAHARARVLAYVACMSAPSSTCRVHACLHVYVARYALLATSSHRPIKGGWVW